MKLGQIITIIILSVLVTSLGVAASDSLKVSSGSLLGSLISSGKPVCPKGTVEVKTSPSFTCVDEYEASASLECANTSPDSHEQTATNLNTVACKADSRDVLPWVYINRSEASLACARAGKRLPTASEWYQFSLGTDALSCNVRSQGATISSEFPECISSTGIKQTTGNVWEWTSDDVVDGTYRGRKLPGSGYVDAVDSTGVATSLLADLASSSYLNGYIWSNTSGSFGVIRGGFYGSREDAGVYTVQAQTPSNFSGVAIGFRCVK